MNSANEKMEVYEEQLSWVVEELIVAMDTSRKGFRKFHKNTYNQVVASTEIVCFAGIEGSHGFPVRVSVLVSEEHVQIAVDSGTIFSGYLTGILKQDSDTIVEYVEDTVVRILSGEDVASPPF